jgi:predicted RNA-binding protein with PIN domain
MTRGILIVDGYNVIRSTPPYREIAELDLESARAALVSDVAAYAAGQWDATVVFDGGANERSTGLPHTAAGITVVFSRYGMEADTVIEGLARTARDGGIPTEVVTSDAQTQWAVLGGCVVRRSSGEFAGELRSDESDWREHSSRGGARCRIEDLLDPVVRGTLARWAKGED